MEPRILSQSPFVVLGLQIETQPMSPEIAALWPRFVSRIGEIQAVREPGVSYGVMRMNGRAAARLSYMAAVSVSSAAEVPEGMSVQQIPAGEYAVFEFPFTEIGAAFAYIYGTWLPASGYCQADVPAFERYGEHFNPTDPGSLMEVFVPISKAGHPA